MLKTMIPDIIKEIQARGYWSSEKYKRSRALPTPVTHLRSIYKTISWRILATTDTFIISWFVTGFITWALSIATVEVFTKMFLYYGHERLWLRIRHGRGMQ